MNKDLLSLWFSFAHTDGLGMLLTLMVVMTWKVFEKERYDLVAYFLVGTVVIWLLKSLLKADKTQKREAKIAQPILNEDHEV